jgi:hypothetical protein
MRITKWLRKLYLSVIESIAHQVVIAFYAYGKEKSLLAEETAKVLQEDKAFEKWRVNHSRWIHRERAIAHLEQNPVLDDKQLYDKWRTPGGN